MKMKKYKFIYLLFNYLYCSVISFMFISCCGSSIITNTTKIKRIEIVSDSVVLIDKNFEFDLNPIDTILFTEINNSCYAF